MDLYVTSRLTNSISVLAETVLELDEQQELVVDMERIQITYRWSDLFRLAAGRGHTALGYWNETYHHGLLLQPTVERPEALKFEDDGGLLPVHFVGAELAGGRPGTPGTWPMSSTSPTDAARRPRSCRGQRTRTRARRWGAS